jgi:ribulose-phosphate 3-epimerase
MIHETTDIRLEIDGGVSEHNIKQIAEAGVDMFVAGSAIFKEPRTLDEYSQTIHRMHEQLSAVKF